MSPQLAERTNPTNKRCKNQLITLDIIKYTFVVYHESKMFIIGEDVLLVCFAFAFRILLTTRRTRKLMHKINGHISHVSFFVHYEKSPCT